METSPSYSIAPESASERIATQASGSVAATSATAGWGDIPLLCLISAIGVLVEALADVGGRTAAWWGDVLFWAGLLIIFAPWAWRAIHPGASRTERIIATTALGVEFYIVKVLQYPLRFSQHDEFQHWRSALDIAQTGHLFHANLLLPVSPLYPGLEIVTNALSAVGAVSIFTAATLLIGMARVVVMLALFLFAEAVSHSPQVAAIATIAFVANPLFLFFDAQFAYESLALPLAVCALLVVMRAGEARGRDRWLWLGILWTLIAAVTVTHHLTSYALLAFLAVWYLVWRFAPRLRADPARPGLALIAGIEIGLAWLLIAGGLIVSYLARPLLIGVENVIGIILQEDTTRTLFRDAAGGANPLWQQALALCAVALLTLCAVLGCALLWHAYRRQRLASAAWLTLGVVSLSYPASQLLRLTKDGASYATRPMDFFFIAAACMTPVVAMRLSAIHWPPARARWLAALSPRALTMVGLLIVVAGGVAIGSGPTWARLPGPHIVEGNQRSFGPEDIAAAQWSRLYLGAGNRVATDQDDELLMGTYGLQDIVTPAQGVDLANVFFAPTIGPFQRTLLRSAKVRYVVIDLRLSTALPANGFYYVPGEAGTHGMQVPISRQALTKYGSTPGIDTIYDSGAMQIYDVSSLTAPNSQETP